MAEYLSINTGQKRWYTFGNVRFESAVQKEKAAVPRYLSSLFLEGDVQSDAKHHGGEYKAVFFYEAAHYQRWESLIGRLLPWGSLGETVTTRDFSEQEVCIGDVYQIGEARVQITQPRQPCFKLGYVTGRKDFPVRMEERGWTGFYAKVLQEGILPPEGGIELISRDPMGLSVNKINELLVHDRHNRETMEQALENRALSPSMVRIFKGRLAGEAEDDAKRLFG